MPCESFEESGLSLPLDGLPSIFMLGLKGSPQLDPDMTGIYDVRAAKQSNHILKHKNALLGRPSPSGPQALQNPTKQHRHQPTTASSTHLTVLKLLILT